MRRVRPDAIQQCCSCMWEKNFFWNKISHSPPCLEDDVVVFSHLLARDFLFLDGDKSSSLYFLCSGCVKCFRTTDGGREQILRIIMPGQLFGLPPLISGSNHRLTAQAIVPSHVCKMDSSRFMEILRSNHDACLGIINIMGDQLWMATGSVGELHYGCRDRLRFKLIEIGKAFGEISGGMLHFDMPFSRDELAHITGMARETVSRQLKKLVTAGVLKIENREYFLDARYVNK